MVVYPQQTKHHPRSQASPACSLGLGFRASSASFSSITRVGTAISFCALGKSLGLICRWVPWRNPLEEMGWKWMKLPLQGEGLWQPPFIPALAQWIACFKICRIWPNKHRKPFRAHVDVCATEAQKMNAAWWFKHLRNPRRSVHSA